MSFLLLVKYNGKIERIFWIDEVHFLWMKLLQIDDIQDEIWYFKEYLLIFQFFLMQSTRKWPSQSLACA